MQRITLLPLAAGLDYLDLRGTVCVSTFTTTDHLMSPASKFEAYFNSQHIPAVEWLTGVGLMEKNKHSEMDSPACKEVS